MRETMWSGISVRRNMFKEKNGKNGGVLYENGILQIESSRIDGIPYRIHSQYEENTRKETSIQEMYDREKHSYYERIV